MEMKPSNVRVETFMASIGSEAVITFNMYGLTPAEFRKITTINSHICSHFTTKVKITYERCTFNRISQGDGESFDDFLDEV